MGNWNISIEGIGPHHNNDFPGDAEKLAKKFVEELRSNSQVVTKATFTYGGAEDLNSEE